MTENKVSLNEEELDQVTGGTVLPYLVTSGDSLDSLAKRFHVSEDQLCRWNHLKADSILSLGQKLIIKF